MAEFFLTRSPVTPIEVRNPITMRSSSVRLGKPISELSVNRHVQKVVMYIMRLPRTVKSSRSHRAGNTTQTAMNIANTISDSSRSEISMYAMVTTISHGVSMYNQLGSFKKKAKAVQP